MGSGWINFLIFVLVIGAPAAGSIWKKLEEKKEQRRVEGARQRLREEHLRTGKVQTLQASTPEPARSSASADIDAQRRARLEELRKRQQERLRQAAQARTPSSAPSPSQTSRAQVRSVPASASSRSPSRTASTPPPPSDAPLSGDANPAREARRACAGDGAFVPSGEDINAPGAPPGVRAGSKPRRALRRSELP